jgi:hypothetical protein
VTAIPFDIIRARCARKYCRAQFQPERSEHARRVCAGRKHRRLGRGDKGVQVPDRHKRRRLSSRFHQRWQLYRRGKGYSDVANTVDNESADACAGTRAPSTGSLIVPTGKAWRPALETKQFGSGVGTRRSDPRRLRSRLRHCLDLALRVLQVERRHTKKVGNTLRQIHLARIL